MSRFEAWSLVFSGAQVLAATVTLILAGAALRTWKQQIDYSALSEVASRTQRLWIQALTAIREARDTDYYTFLDESCKSGFNVTEDNEPLFGAIYSTYQILYDSRSVFDGLRHAAVDLKFLCNIDLSSEVNELSDMRYRLMTASMKAANIRFSPRRPEIIDENELQMYEDAIFSRQNDQFGQELDRLAASIDGKLRGAYIRPFLR
ncbi:hypothetical protein [Rhizobium johnstonii]|uniref:hypothetical protein n=1 Tax=Rhizobium johnstonii TaxID=3019933 RepID=UPI003F9655F5